MKNVSLFWNSEVPELWDQVTVEVNVVVCLSLLSYKLGLIFLFMIQYKKKILLNKDIMLTISSVPL